MSNGRSTSASPVSATPASRPRQNEWTVVSRSHGLLLAFQHVAETSASRAFSKPFVSDT